MKLMMCRTLGIGSRSLIDSMRQRIVDPSLTYGKGLIRLIKEEGYINSQIKLSQVNKVTSKYLLENTGMLEDERFKEYVPIALQGAKK